VLAYLVHLALRTSGIGLRTGPGAAPVGSPGTEDAPSLGTEATGSGPSRCLVIAATHDLEIVSLLAPDYAVVHFADELRDGGLHFDYLLRPGPTTTRNAIALLGVLGAPPQVVAEALARTERLRGDQRKPL
jgi:hypothetical protein